MNSSGPISLGGTTAGQSIEVELGGGGTTMISLNDTNVRTLAGVPSGAIIMPTNFWGTSSASYFIAAFKITNSVVPIDALFDSSGNVFVNMGYNNPTFTQAVQIGSISASGSITSQKYIAPSNNVNSWYPTTNGSTLIDSSNNVYSMGTYASGKATIAKLDTSGNVSFSTYFGTSSSSNGQLIITNSATGYIYGIVNDGGLGGSRSCIYIFPSTYNGTGTVTYWAIGYSNSSSSYRNNPESVSPIFSNTFVIATRWPQLSLSLLTVLSTAGSSLTQVSQYTVNSSNLFLGSMGWDSSGNLYLCGSDSGIVKFFIAQCASANISSFTWQKYITIVAPNTTVINGPFGLTTDSSGNSYLVASYYTYTLQEYVGVIFKYNSSGTLQWQRTVQVFWATTIGTGSVGGGGELGVQFNNYPRVDTNGNLLLSGSAYNPSYNGYRFNFVLKIPTDGSLLGMYLVTASDSGTSNFYVNYSYGSATDATSSLTTTGYTTSNIASGTVSSNTLSSTYTPTSSSLVTATGTISSSPTSGSITYSVAGTYSWICPTGVTSVSVVCIGGGGSGQTGNGAFTGGGGGGGLGYKNNYSVTPGNSYTVVVGVGGQYSVSGGNANDGGDSYFVSTSVVKGGFGTGGVTGLGGTYVGDGGGAGGAGGPQGGTYNSGGGGAGGYAGTGGHGGGNLGSGNPAGSNPTTGSGGGGGGAGANSNAQGGGGGGVFVYGKGSDGVGNTTIRNGGSGGSGGASGNYSTNAWGGLFGGGGGGGYYVPCCCCCGHYTPPVFGSGGSGGNGAVRIVWPGSSRTFPSTNVGTP